jgi:hypothetical protein
MAGALAGLLYDGQYAAAEFSTGGSDLLTVFAAAIIGGTSLMGGMGSVVGAVVGSLLIGTLNNALILINLGAPEQLIARGIIIVVAVILSSRPPSRRQVWHWLARLEGYDAGPVGPRPPTDGTGSATLAEGPVGAASGTDKSADRG